jgi:F0F1-type ATP synthase membrane subunit b/b'
MFDLLTLTIIAILIGIVIGSGAFLYKRYKLLWEFIWKIKTTQEEIKATLEEIKATHQETKNTQEETKITQENIQASHQEIQENIQASYQEIQENIQASYQEIQENIQASYQEIQENIQTSYQDMYRISRQLRTNQEALVNVLKDIASWQRKEIRIESLGDKARLSYKERSVIFLHNSYYHFYYLAQALRRRGWDAVSVSCDDPINGSHVNYYHGEDINLFSPDPVKFHQKIEDFFDEAKQRFALLHFAGDGIMSFFPENWQKEHPEDIIEWRRLGKKVAYTISGCNSAVAQTTVAEWSAMNDGRVVCNSCVWQNRPEICSDSKNLRWGKKVDTYCDLIFGETVPALDYLDSPKTIFEPVTMCLDPNVWYPELPVPEQFKIAKDDTEFLVYHAVGNYHLRTKENGRNIKGTPAVIEAVDRLKSEGLPVRLIFVTGMRNIDVRYIQVQADVIVDQLNYGRYGATSREGMMLGKPVICYLNKREKKSGYYLPCLDDIPLVSATEDTIYHVLKELLLDKERRLVLGKKSYDYAMKWHSADACAERYEQIYDRLMTGYTVKAISQTMDFKVGSV